MMMAAVSPDSDFGRFASRVRKLREALGKSQQEFAEMIGVSRSFLSNVENQTSKPSADMILGLLKLTSKSKLVTVESGVAIEQVLSETPINRDWLLLGEGHMFWPSDGRPGEGSFAGTFRVGADVPFRMDDRRAAYAGLARIEERVGHKLPEGVAELVVHLLCEVAVGSQMMWREGGPQSHGDAPVGAWVGAPKEMQDEVNRRADLIGDILAGQK